MVIKGKFLLKLWEKNVWKENEEKYEVMPKDQFVVALQTMPWSMEHR